MINAFLLLASLAPPIQTTESAQIDIQLDRPTVKVSPSLYGIFFEEINQGGEGGLYGEMIRSRGLEGNGETLPAGWSGFGEGTSVSLDSANPLNDARRRSLRIQRKSGTGGVRNAGFWGISVRKGARYRLTTWTKGPGKMSVWLDNPASIKLTGSAEIPPSDGWRRIETIIRADATEPQARLTISPLGSDPAWVGFASLMPIDTWKGRPNGLRKDLATHVADMKPSFVRFPGGCYVEGGDKLSDAFNWQASLGPQEGRAGLAHSMWGYTVSDGLGYHEYLQWCEDLRAAPLFVVNCGLSHREMVPMADMGKFVQSALDAIEYANGPVASKWGALRAKNGHPKSFNLKYVEIGNENGASWSYGGPAGYASRYKLVYDAIKKAHPEIVTIADNPVPHPMEVIDEHYYSSPDWFWHNANRYDAYDRKGPKIYVGEYAVTEGCGQGNLAAALGEAAFMTGMERNSDIVQMSSYAPLFVNVNNRQWNPDAIVFDVNRSYGTPSYWVQNLFANNRPDRILACKASSPEPKSPQILGSIGLQTWRTSSEFKDISLEVDGKPVSRLGTMQVLRGTWNRNGSEIAQTELDTDRQAYFPDLHLEGAKRYSLSLKARKREGEEGFIVMFEHHADGSSLQWNLGGWGNTQHAFQRGGTIVGKALPGRIEANRWYDIRIEKEGSHTRGYLDGKLIQELDEPGVPDFAAVAGLDEKAGEIVVKVVNSSNSARGTSLNFRGGDLASTGRVITLTGSRLDEENSFDSPTRIAPKESQVAVRANTKLQLPPRSLVILRVKLAAKQN